MRSKSPFQRPADAPANLFECPGGGGDFVDDVIARLNAALDVDPEIVSALLDSKVKFADDTLKDLIGADDNEISALRFLQYVVFGSVPAARRHMRGIQQVYEYSDGSTRRVIQLFRRAGEGEGDPASK